MSRKIIDLSVVCSNKTKGVKIKLQRRLPVYLGQTCYAYDLEIKSHTRTYFETSAHVFRKGKNTDEVSLEKLILPGRCVRVKDKEKCITAEKLNSLCPDLKPNCALLVDTGRDFRKYFSRDAARWMAKRKVALMGSNLPRYDTGFVNPVRKQISLTVLRKGGTEPPFASQDLPPTKSVVFPNGVNPTGFFIDLFKAEIPIIANITNLDKLSESGFTLVVMPLKIAGVCTCPARVIAIVENK